MKKNNISTIFNPGDKVIYQPTGKLLTVVNNVGFLGGMTNTLYIPCADINNKIDDYVENNLEHYNPQEKTYTESEVIDLITKIRDNYSVNIEMKNSVLLPKNQWRKDFTNEIYDIKDIIEKLR